MQSKQKWVITEYIEVIHKHSSLDLSAPLAAELGSKQRVSCFFLE
jgi:hypothetical protein